MMTITLITLSDNRNYNTDDNVARDNNNNNDYNNNYIISNYDNDANDNEDDNNKDDCDDDSNIEGKNNDIDDITNSINIRKCFINQPHVMKNTTQLMHTSKAYISRGLQFCRSFCVSFPFPSPCQFSQSATSANSVPKRVRGLWPGHFGLQ